jgi:hypothetical protein
MGLHIDTSRVTGFDTIERFSGTREVMEMRLDADFDYRPNWRWADEAQTTIERMNVTTFTLGFMSMITGIPEITAKNYKEVALRVAMYEMLHNTALPLTFEEVKAHIGLRTNVKPKTKSQFNKTISDALREKAQAELNRLTRQEAA